MQHTDSSEADSLSFELIPSSALSGIVVESLSHLRILL